MFFVLSKIFWTLLQPLNAFCVLGAAGILAKIRWPKAGNRMVLTALALIIAFGVLPVGPWLMISLERQYPTPTILPDKVDGIVVLGGAFEAYLSQQSGHIVANDQVDRMICFVELAKRYPGAKLVFSGGSGDLLHPDAMESADAAKFFAISGLEKDRVQYETRSRNTYENVLFSKEMVQPNPDDTWILSTSAYHMPRSVGIFARFDWPVLPYQCDVKTDGRFRFGELPFNIIGNYYLLNLALKEYVGSVVYYLTGKTAFILPPRPVPSQAS